jgi:hypothetical protein
VKVIRRRGPHVIIALSCAGWVGACCPPFCSTTTTPPDPCSAQRVRVLRQASNGLVHTLSDPGHPADKGTEWAFQSSNGTLHLRKPDDLIGYAFRMTHGGNTWDDALLATVFVLQYDLPVQPCTANIAWRVQAVADFPTGYLFVNEGDLYLDVEFFAFQDPNGIFDIATTDSALMLQTIRQFHSSAAESGNRDIFGRWYADRNDKGPVGTSHMLRGDFVVTANRLTRVFIAASVAIRGVNPGERGCIGCTIEIDSLAEAGLFRGVAPGAKSDDQGFFGPEVIVTP